MFDVWRLYNRSVVKWCRWLSLCVDAGEIYIPSKCVFFRILHQNMAQYIIQCHDNKIWKQMCIKKSFYSTDTYLRYRIRRGKTGEKYMWDLHHELVIFLQSRNCFRYVPDNEIKGDILGWTTSYINCNYLLLLLMMLLLFSDTVANYVNKRDRHIIIRQ